MRNLNQSNRIFISILLLIAFEISTFKIQANEKFPDIIPQPLKWSQEGVRILLKDDLKLPDMSWPQTLLEYSIDFNSEKVSRDDLVLIDLGTGDAVPFQLTNITSIDRVLLSADLCFLSDLPTGTKREFQLSLKQKHVGIDNPLLQGRVEKEKIGDKVHLNNGLLKVDILAPGEYRKLIPPILHIGNSDQWLGYSEMPSNLIIDKLVVKELSAGDLLTNYHFDYQFKGDKRFQINICLVAGMDFLEMEENMTGFTEADSLSWEIIWDNFRPEFRYCPNRPGAPINKTEKGYKNFAWEPIDGFNGDPLALKHPELPYDQQNLPNGQLPFKIAPYHNWMTWWRLPSAAFWNEQTGQSVGLFIKDFEKWIDPAYPIWGSKDNLSIHFFHKNKSFLWRFPLVEGKRSLALAVYDHKKDIEVCNQTNLPQVNIDYLRRWYGWISLNKTKDWVLDYASGKPMHPIFFSSEAQEAKFNPKDLLNNLKRTVNGMSEAGERSKGPNPVGTRTYYDNIAPLFENAEATLTEPEYRQARALFLFMTYVFMDETLMPMRNMLSGHPNFLADIKGVPGLAAFLFPDHPQAKEMADHFEKSIALNLRYHTRPTEPAWEATGGRWTENLSCYTWAFLRPTLKTSFLLHYFYDGKNRMLQPNISLYGGWLLNSLTSPLDNAKGRRTYPPQGAHSRVLTPSNMLFTLGQELYYYDPLLAEKIFWVSSPDDQGFENKAGRPDSWDGPAKGLFKNPGGTNPHLKSAKYTGYGFNLRSNFGQPDEMYIQLQQIDDGPNYRWGRAAKGGNGIIYYYAEGKQYSHNGIEDVGDAPFGDTERCTNFGVKKEKSYRCIGDYRSVGRNDLTDPLFDFGFAQFASIRANDEAAPEYKSRSVLMSGNDYILIFDDVKDISVEGRLSWFVGKDDDFPFIHQIKPGVEGNDANIKPANFPYYKDKGDLMTKGRYYDGKGDFLTLVTHREKITPVFEKNAYRINKPDASVEWVFRNDETVTFNQGQLGFEGTAGIIRQSADKKRYEGALFQGKKIGIPGLTVEFIKPAQHQGMSLNNTDSGFAGIVQVRKEAEVQFTLKTLSKGMIFFLDGIEAKLNEVGKGLYSLNVPSGKHDWQWTNAGVIPGTPAITRSVSGTNWCELEWSSVPGAVSYSVQKSTDCGLTWVNIAEAVSSTKYKVAGLTDGKKVHVRVFAKGKGGISEPSDDYPVYTGSAKPHTPEGLRAVKTDNVVNLSWGQILGADQYSIYQREKGSSEFRKVYSGTSREAVIELDGDQKICEFAVTATNGNGESEKSVIADTDENRLINWYPIPGEIFRRDTESQENGYGEYNHWIEQEMPVLKYPFQMKSK